MQPLKHRLKKGERAAFVELYDLIGDQLFRYVFSQMGSADTAADVIQEVFVRLVKSHRSVGKADDLKSYVFTIARNEIRRWLDRTKRTQVASLVDPNAIESGSTDLSDLDGDEWTRHLLKQLDPTDAEIIQLKIYSQLTFLEISDVLDMNQATVATRYHRAIEKLRNKLQQSNQSVGEEKAI